MRDAWDGVDMDANFLVLESLNIEFNNLTQYSLRIFRTKSANPNFLFSQRVQIKFFTKFLCNVASLATTIKEKSSFHGLS